MLRRASCNEGCDSGVCVDSLWASFPSLLCPLFSFPSLMQLLAQTKGVLPCRSQEQPKLGMNCAAFCTTFDLPAASQSCRLIGEQILEPAVDKFELNSNPACILLPWDGRASSSPVGTQEAVVVDATDAVNRDSSCPCAISH